MIFLPILVQPQGNCAAGTDSFSRALALPRFAVPSCDSAFAHQQPENAIELPLFQTVPDVKLEEKELGSQDITPAEKRQPPTQAFCSCCEQHMSRCEVLEQENVRIR